MMTIIEQQANVSMQLLTGYQFTPLENLEALQNTLHLKGQALKLMGTILLSSEGINVNVTASEEVCQTFKAFIGGIEDLQINLRMYPIEAIPFKKFIVKIRPEIITLGEQLTQKPKHTIIEPHTLAQWYADKKVFNMLDVRNDYEVAAGTFEGAKHLQLKSFSEFPGKLKEYVMDKNVPTVITCTGGIRCEKASIVMSRLGFTDIYHMNGGILHYFKEQQNAFFHGGCFVFDNRLIVDHQFKAVSGAHVA